MVAWSDELNRVDGQPTRSLYIYVNSTHSETSPFTEFWRIRSLVESTAIGGRAVMRRRSVQETQEYVSQLYHIPEIIALSDRRLIPLSARNAP